MVETLLEKIIEQKDRERDRLNSRIHLITGTPVAAGLRRYRREINKLGAIKARNVRAFTTRDGNWRAEDEIALCHAYLDRKKITTML